MIPKKIHYCWFGGNPLPQDALMCIESWKKYFPDYEIIEWNEKNFDMNSCDYIREAAENKKWAFVSDFARFKILYDFGGIYFDTDVEVVRNFDEIIAMGAFMGKEEPQDSTTYVINPGLGMAAEQGNGFCLDVIEYYKTIHFDFNNIITVCEHVTRCLKKKGYIQLFQSTHIFNRETGAMSQLAESSTKQWRLADTFVCGRGVPIGKFVRPYLHFKGKEQGRIDLTLTL